MNMNGAFYDLMIVVDVCLRIVLLLFMGTQQINDISFFLSPTFMLRDMHNFAHSPCFNKWFL
mgnify:FL=1